MKTYNEFDVRVGLFLGIACANLMGVSITLAVCMDDGYYAIPLTISVIGMIGGFWVFCNPKNTSNDA